VRLRVSFEAADFALTAALPLFSLGRTFVAPLRFRVALGTDVVLFFDAAVPLVFFVDFLRAAIGKLSTHN